MIPSIMSFCLNNTIPFRSGKNNKVIKPIAAPTPCIFEAVVTITLLSFTLKNPEISPAPTAKIPIERSMKNARTGNLAFNDKKYAPAVYAKKPPSQISHKL